MTAAGPKIRGVQLYWDDGLRTDELSAIDPDALAVADQGTQRLGLWLLANCRDVVLAKVLQAKGV